MEKTEPKRKLNCLFWFLKECDGVSFVRVCNIEGERTEGRQERRKEVPFFWFFFFTG